MKRSRRINILILVFFHLLVFATPLTIKAEHYHTGVSYVTNHPDGKIITKAEETCPICKFEFVHLLTPPINQFHVLLLIKPLENIDCASVEYTAPFYHFSGRAPPFC